MGSLDINSESQVQRWIAYLLEGIITSISLDQTVKVIENRQIAGWNVVLYLPMDHNKFLSLPSR